MEEGKRKTTSLDYQTDAFSIAFLLSPVSSSPTHVPQAKEERSQVISSNVSL